MIAGAVIFDLDGVLCDCRDVHYEALNAALAAAGVAPISPAEHAGAFDGLPTRVKLAALVESGRLDPDRADAVATEKQARTEVLMGDRVAFDPGAWCLWHGLRAAGVRVAVCTNAVARTADLVLRRLALRPDVLTTNEDGRPKPDPDLYRITAGRLALPPGACLAVEDNPRGVAAATSAGCGVLRVTGPRDVTPAAVWEAMRVCSKS